MDMEKPARNGTPRWVKLLLVLSLGVNLLVAGLVVGAGAHRYHGDDRRAPGGDITAYGPFARALPEAARDRMRENFRARAPELRANRAALRESFHDLRAALKAVPYDEAAVVRILDQQRAQIDGQTLIVRELFLKEVAGMSDAERAELADNLRRVVRRGPPKDDIRRD